ncbi:hypothetical protein B0H11DRAFT_1928112 [Mycena galericulata]|nr:hypothetical protein B0H11DRAFT_1928112 [Mycena galericulata]
MKKLKGERGLRCKGRSRSPPQCSRLGDRIKGQRSLRRQNSSSGGSQIEIENILDNFFTRAALQACWFDDFLKAGVDINLLLHLARLSATHLSECLVEQFPGNISDPQSNSRSKVYNSAGCPYTITICIREELKDYALERKKVNYCKSISRSLPRLYCGAGNKQDRDGGGKPTLDPNLAYEPPRQKEKLGQQALEARVPVQVGRQHQTLLRIQLKLRGSGTGVPDDIVEEAHEVAEDEGGRRGGCPGRHPGGSADPGRLHTRIRVKDIETD